jgi:hypothetical protein
MEKTTLGLLAALGAAAATPASAYAPAAAANSILHPTSVAELLAPVANPMETLSALQSQPKPLEVADELTIGVPGVVLHHHHHHHHHHMFFRHHHHHHHHYHHYDDNN